MVFKRNITITLACVITECLISLIPMIFIIYLFFMMDKIDEIFSTLLIVPYFILIINVILIIISFIAQIFIKTKYYVNAECLVIKTKTQNKEINYNEIKGTSFGVEYEWRIHNAVYYGGKALKFAGVEKLFGKSIDDIIEQSSNVDIGASIFEDHHGAASGILHLGYLIHNPFGAIHDLLLHWWKKAHED